MRLPNLARASLFATEKLARPSLAIFKRADSGARERLFARLAMVFESPLLCGVLAGIYVLTVCHHFFASFGTSRLFVMVAVLTWAAAITAGVRPRAAARTGLGHSEVVWALAHLCLAAWVVGFGLLLQAAFWLAGQLGPEHLAQRLWGAMFAAGTAMVLFGPPAFAIGRMSLLIVERQRRHLQNSSRSMSDGAATIGSFLIGIAAGLLLDAFLLAPIIGVNTAGLMAACTGGVVCFLGALRHFLYRQDQPNTATTPSVELKADARADAMRAGNHVGATEPVVWTTAAVLLMGASLALTNRSLSQLMPMAGYIAYFQCASLIAGLACSLFYIRRRAANSRSASARGAWPCLLVSVVTLGVIVGFPLLVDAMLLMNAHVSHVPLMMLLRGGVASITFFVVGIGWGNLTRPQHQSGGTTHRLTPIVLAVGFVMGTWLVGSAGNVGLMTIGVAWTLAILGVVRRNPIEALKINRRASLATATALVAIVLAPLLGGRPDASRSAKLLFSTGVFAAKQAGYDDQLLTVLDDARHIATVEGERGTYTLFKRRGVQLHVRENGIPKSSASTNLDICPDFAAESLQTILPLVLHEHPQRVLLVGVGAGVPLTTCLGFPIPEITCAEDDGRLIDLLQDHVWPASGIDPLGDERVRLLPLEPALAVCGQPATYDVIISSPDMSSLLKSTPYSTREFYRHAANMLGENGMFCQRFQSIDYGPKPLRVVCQTLKAAFADVAAVAVARGEFLLIATNSKHGLVRENLIERLQRPHVRQSFANVGWDWSIALNLAACYQQGLTEFLNDSAPELNTAANGRFAFGLPQEVIGWAPKMKQLMAELNEHASFILDWEGVDALDPEIQRRHSELAEQNKLLADHPDQKWAYRKALREQMTSRRASLINQISHKLGENLLHPQDERRKEYLSTLSDAVQTPVPEAIDRVAAFTEPYDPLLSYFAHYEAASLWAKVEPRQTDVELHHRLHLVYHTTARDRSVRNVSKAILLLAQHPEAVSDASERYDHTSGLLQVLKARWNLRASVKPQNVRIELNDINRSIQAMEQAFAMIDGLESELDLKEGEWPARRTYLDKALLRPLRSYSDRLLPIHLKHKRRAQQMLESSAAERQP